MTASQIDDPDDSHVDTDGTVEGDPRDEGPGTAVTRRAGSSRLLLVGLSVALTLVIVACVVVLGLRLSRDTDPDAGLGERAVSLVAPGDATDVQAERETVMRQARQFVLRVFTYGPDDLEGEQMPGYVQGVEELITPAFAVDFEESSQLAVQPVLQAGYGRRAEVSLVGVRDLGDDAATVMIAGNFVSSYPAAAEGQPRQETKPVPLRFDVSLVRTGGEWLVDDFAPVTNGAQADDDGAATDPAAPGDPTTPVDPAPTTPATGQGEEGSP